MSSRLALLIMLFPLLIHSIGCGSNSPQAGPVDNANVEPKAMADELANLAGTWVYERQVVEGREAQMDKDRIVIKANIVVRTVHSTDGEELTPLRSKISIDPTANPKQMDDILSVPILGDRRRTGIYLLEGDRLTLCYDNTGASRPSAFESPAGSSIVLSVLRRQSK
jgi:uncharacterized protein (TIGR03067 family)